MASNNIIKIPTFLLELKSPEKVFNEYEVPKANKFFKPTHLWQYLIPHHFINVELNHKTKKPYFETWKEFLEQGGIALNCNCTYNSPLLGWYWLDQANSDAINNPQCTADDYDPETTIIFDIVTFIYCSSIENPYLSAIKIKVTKEDEQEIRKFISERQILV